MEDVKDNIEPEPVEKPVEPIEEFTPSSDATVQEDKIKPPDASKTDQEGKQTDVKIPEEITMEKEKADEDLAKKLKPKKQVKFDEDSLKESVTEVSAKKDQEQKSVSAEVDDNEEQQQIMKSPEPTKKKKIKKVKKSKEKSLLVQEEEDDLADQPQAQPEIKTDNTDDTATTIETALLKDSESSRDTTLTDLDSKDISDIRDNTIIKVVESTEIPPSKIDQSKDDNISLKHELKDISKDDIIIPKDEQPSKTEDPKDTSKDTTSMPNNQTETPETLQIIPETHDSPTDVADDTSATSVGRVREETKVILRLSPQYSQESLVGNKMNGLLLAAGKQGRTTEHSFSFPPTFLTILLDQNRNTIVKWNFNSSS